MSARDFRVETLTLDQIRAIYAQRMPRDFPPDEIKRLAYIERALSRGEYICYGALDGDAILAYAFFVRKAGRALFDYYAVREDLRDQGIGSRFIQALIEGPLQGLECVLLEVEDPACASDAAERTTRERRLDFYLRNGLWDTGVSAAAFHVPYKLLVLPVGERPSRALVREIYAEMYRLVLPDALFREMIEV